MIDLERGVARRTPAKWRTLARRLGYLPARLARLGPPAAALIFAVALLTRLLWSTVPVNIDEDLWMRRGPSFLVALIQGDLPGTYLRHHPGVTNMWLIGGALAARFGLRGLLPADDLARQCGNLVAYLAAVAQSSAIPAGLYAGVRLPFALVTAGCLAGIYALSRRLFGKPVAFIATVILLFEPFFLAYQRSLTTDANQTNFTWLALLAFLLALRTEEEERPPQAGWLLLSALCYGLAVLSKVTALLSLPALGLWALWQLWREKPAGSRHRLLLGLLAWGLAAGAVIFLLWPALWSNPVGILARLQHDIGGELEGHSQFFFGQPTLAPGTAFYPIVLLFRSSPLLLLGTAAGALSLALPSLRRHLPGRGAMGAVALNLAVVLAGLTLSASKIDRYVVPLMPGMALLAAAGGWAAVCLWNEKTGRAAADRPRLALALAGSAALLQLAVLLPHFPYYLTYYNPLLGGPAQAEKMLMLGNGELMDRAAAWLNGQPETAGAPVASWYATALAPYYEGPVTELFSDPTPSGEYDPLFADAGYVVLYVNQVQRELAPVPYFAAQRPLYAVQAHGVDYARIYPGPAVGQAGLAAIPQQASLDFGDSARLLGYELQTPQVEAGDTVVLSLYWEALALFDAPDYSVYLGVRDAAGNRFGRSDSQPVGGYLPVSRWQAGKVVRDVEQVRVLPGTPPGQYHLEIGFYSAQLSHNLEIRDQNGPRGTQTALVDLTVTRPAHLPLPGTDLGISQQLDTPVTLGDAGPRLLGYDWPQPDTLAAGDAVPLSLLWQAGERADDAQIYLQLSAAGRRWRRAQGHLQGGDYPPAGWTTGELVRDTWDALLPADVPAGRYQVDLVAETAAGDTQLIGLGQVEIQARPHVFDTPHPDAAQQADLGNMARLLGYDLPAQVTPGGTLRVALYWQALAEAERSYVRFIHLLDTAGQIVAQQDGVPGAGALPTTSWVAGEVLADDAVLDLPGTMPPGTYRLAVGLYDPATGRRLAGRSGDDRILLSQAVEVR